MTRKATVHYRKAVVAGALAALVVVLPTGARAQADWPSKPIKFISPSAPASTPDVLARAIADKLKDSLKQPVIVENQFGAGGMIGHEAAAKAAPDGNTMILTFIGAMVFSPYLYKNVRYDPIKSFAPVVLVSTLPNVLLVSPSLPVNNLMEFVQLLKKNPGKYNYASASTGTSSHLVMELFKEQAGVDIVHVPFSKATDAMASVISGDTHANLAIPSPSVTSHVASGRMKMLAVTSAKRYSLTPDVPTMAEVGYPGMVVEGWNGVLVPANTPRPIVERLNREINAILKSPDMVDRLRKAGIEPGGGTPESFAAIIRADNERWSAVIKRAGIQPN